MKFVVSTLQVKSDEIHDQQNQLKRFNDPKITLHHLHQHREIPWKRLNPMGKNTTEIMGHSAKKCRKTPKNYDSREETPENANPSWNPLKNYSLRITKNSRFPLSTKVCKLSSLAVIFPNCSSIKSPKTFTKHNPPQTFRTSPYPTYLSPFYLSCLANHRPPKPPSWNLDIVEGAGSRVRLQLGTTSVQNTKTNQRKKTDLRFQQQKVVWALEQRRFQHVFCCVLATFFGFKLSGIGLVKSFEFGIGKMSTLEHTECWFHFWTKKQSAT